MLQKRLDAVKVKSLFNLYFQLKHIMKWRFKIGIGMRKTFFFVDILQRAGFCLLVQEAKKMVG